MAEDIIVVGAGAAGMMAACHAAQQGASVQLFDKNRKTGKKLRITGKGRCNLTNDCDVREVLNHIPGEGRFLYSALAAFPPDAVMRFFEDNGLPLKTERGKRVFPQSDNANDVANLLELLCRRNGVRIHQTEVSCLTIHDGAITGVSDGERIYACRACILCTGGKSYPLTGSTGDGYRFGRLLGHTVTELRPSLVPLESTDECCQRLQGLSLKNVTLKVYEDGKLLCKEQGEMLFTHFGVSGPLVLSASARMRKIGLAEYRLEIDLKPALDEHALDQRILRDFKKYQNKEIRNALVELVPHSLIPELLKLSDIPDNIQVNGVTKEMRLKLMHVLKAFPIAVSGTRPYAEAIVTAGGIKTSEVDPRTMQSKLIKGLFFAGELLDLDAYTGGFNLQIAWSTGRLAGLSAAKYLMNE